MLALPGHTSKQGTGNKPKNHLTEKPPYKSPPQVLQIDGRLCHLVLAFLTLETLQMAGPLRSTDITPLPCYYGPSRHPLVFGRLPGVAGYTAYLAPAISRRDEEGFSSCSACPCHRAVASTPPR